MRKFKYEIEIAPGAFTFLIWFACWIAAMYFVVTDNLAVAMMFLLASEFLLVPAFITPVFKWNKIRRKTKDEEN